MVIKVTKIIINNYWFQDLYKTKQVILWLNIHNNLFLVVNKDSIIGIT